MCKRQSTNQATIAHRQNLLRRADRIQATATTTATTERAKPYSSPDVLGRALQRNFDPISLLPSPSYLPYLQEPRIAAPRVGRVIHYRVIHYKNGTIE